MTMKIVPNLLALLLLSLLVLIPVALWAGPQEVFTGDYQPGAWNVSKGLEMAPGPGDRGAQCTWNFSKEVTYGWFRVSSPPPHGGAMALQVTLAGAPDLALQVILCDLADKKKQRYWAHPSPIVGSEKGQTFTLNLTEFVDEMGKAPTAAESAGISLIMFKARGNRKQVVVVHQIAYVENTGTGESAGAEMPGQVSWKKFFTLLDPNMPAMKPILAAESAGKRDVALRLLARHFRERATPGWLYDFRHPVKGGDFNARVAHDGVAARFSILKESYTHPNGDINWTYNPTIGKPWATAEWVFGNARMGWWGDLAAAWWSTGDSQYSKAFVRQLTGFIKTQPCPPAKNESPGSTWRELEAGQRMQVSWAGAFHRFQTAPEFTDEVLVAMVKSMVEHGFMLRGCPHEEGNHHIIGLCGLHTVGALFPEIIPAKEWRLHAIEELILPFKNRASGWLEDGQWFERSPSYHQWLVGKYVALLKVAQVAGCLDEIPHVMRKGMQKAIEVEIAMGNPSRTRPEVNDCGPGSWIKMNFDDGLSLYPESALMRWAASVQSNKPIPPPPAAIDHWLPDSGYLMTRSGAGTNDSYILFDTGSLGGWHGHKDKLNLIAWFDGVEWLYDNGGGDYDASPFRSYAMSTKSHSTVLVDGKNQFRPFTESDPAGTDRKETPEPSALFSGDRTTAKAWFVGSYTEYDRQDKVPSEDPLFRHRREITFLKPRTLVVVDTLFPPDKGSHDYEARWQVRREDFEVLADRLTTLAGKAGAPRLAIIPLDTKGLSVAGHVGKKDPLIGWDVVHGGPPIPALTLCHGKSGAGTVRMVTVITPVPGESALPKVSAHGEGSWNLAWPDGRNLIIACGPVEAGGLTVK